MSMHQIESFIEISVIAVADSALPVSEKRNLIYTLFILEGYGDCGFTHRRTTKQMVDSSYTFLFDKTEMWDYGSNAGFYDELYEKGIFSNGSIYTYEDYDDLFPEAEGKICVDSGSPAWEAMVAAGKITGDGAKPVTRLSFVETLRTVKFLTEKQEGPLNSYNFDGLAMLFMMSGATDEANALTDPDEVYMELLGVTREQAEDEDFEDYAPPEPSEDDPETPSRVFRLNQSLIPFALDNDFAPDKTLILAGYKSTLPYITRNNGQKIHITIRYIPKSWPLRFNIFATDDRPVSWLETIEEDAQELGDCVWGNTINVIEQLRTSDEYGEFLDIENIQHAISKIFKHMAKDTIPLSKLPKLLDIMSECWHEADLPEEAINESNPLTLFLMIMEINNQYWRALIDHQGGSGKYETTVAALKKHSDIVKKRLDRHLRVIDEKYPKSLEDISHYAALVAELTELSQNPQPENRTRRMELMRKIINSPCASIMQRMQYSYELIMFLANALDRVYETTDALVEQNLYMPDSAEVTAKLERKLALFDCFPPQRDCVLTVKHDVVDGVTFDNDEVTVFVPLFNQEISVFLDSDVSTGFLDYAAKCADALRSLPDDVINKLCEYSNVYCEDFCDAIGENPPEIKEMRDILKYIQPVSFIIEEPKDESIVIHLELNCDWENEHGLEWLIKDGRILYVGSFTGESPYCEAEYYHNSWNYANLKQD